MGEHAGDGRNPAPTIALVKTSPLLIYPETPDAEELNRQIRAWIVLRRGGSVDLKQRVELTQIDSLPPRHPASISGLPPPSH
jgi:hypothetical protein